MKSTQYEHFSFLSPKMFRSSFHHSTDGTRTTLNIHPAELAQETRDAMFAWFADLQGSPSRLSNVTANLRRLVKEQAKEIQNAGIVMVVNLGTTSST